MNNSNESSSAASSSNIARVLVLGAAAFLAAKSLVLTTVPAGTIGVRFSSASGVFEQDLAPGYHLEVVGLHRVDRLPSSYFFLNYEDDNQFTIRTKDNNTVRVDVSIPYRIKQGEGWKITEAGNQIRNGEGRFRFERFADRAATDVLNSTLSKLSSEDFYDTDRRLAIASEALAVLNEKLSEYNLEADAILIRRANFRAEYEVQLRQIQLNEQNKLLDKAKGAVAAEQQRLDTYEQETQAQVAALGQDWARRIAELDRAYQVGTLKVVDNEPGAARAALEQLETAERETLIAETAKLLGQPAGDIDDAHLLGIKNIQAETREYFDRTTAEADGIKARLLAEASAEVAKVQADYERRVNGLLNSPAGRAFVAYEAAENVTFDKTLTFQSDDGIPSVLRLRDFAVQFMGR